MLFLIEIKKNLYDNVISGRLSPERSSVMKKLPLLFTLALATVCSTGCDAFSFIDGGTTPGTDSGEKTPGDSDQTKPTDPSEDDVWIEDILLPETEAIISIGETYQIDYEVWPRGAYSEVSFESSNKNVATVSSTGLVEGLAEGNSEITLTSYQDTSVTAKFTINVNPAPATSYSVVFIANGGTGSMENDVTTGSTYLTPECEFERANYTFDGWALNSASGTKYGVGATITNISYDIALYATWRDNSQPVVNYNVSFNANGGSGSMSGATTNGSTYQTPSCAFTYTGHTFSKWAVNSPSGTKYDAGSTIYGITGDITLYAIWQEIVTNYTVTFNANGGSGTMASKTTSGSSYMTPACTFTYASHSFKEWALNSLSGTKYAAGATITGISANITLYAIWQDASSDYYAACDGLSGSSLQSKLKDINAPKNPSYDWSRYEAADEAEDDSSSVLCVYTRHNIPKNNHCGSYAWDKWNREHVWTQSAYPASKTDNHNIFACEGQINNERGNKPFAEGGDTVVIFGHTTGCKQTSSTFEPCDEAKGEIARSVMYGTVMYSYTMTNEIDSIYLALKWHLEHSITSRETKRNEVVYGLQGNRNPFVDHPEYACKIWGNTNSQTKSICGM